MSKEHNALDAFITHKNTIDRALARLQALSDNHFDAHPDETNWGHVGDLGRMAAQLTQLTDMAFNEGEFKD